MTDWSNLQGDIIIILPRFNNLSCNKIKCIVDNGSISKNCQSTYVRNGHILGINEGMVSPINVLVSTQASLGDNPVTAISW